MRVLVWLLLLLNAAVFGYFYSAPGPAGDVSGSRPDIAVERLKLLDQQEVASFPARAAAQATESVAMPSPLCYEWGSFSADDASGALAVLNRLGLQSSSRQQTPQEAVRYWVYIPPRKSMEEAQAKVDELRALNVEESFIVQEPRWRFAVSLGVFKDEALATRYLEELRGRGVQSAIKGQRNHEGGQTSYTIRNVQPAQADEIGKLKPEFPGSELKEVDCP